MLMLGPSFPSGFMEEADRAGLPTPQMLVGTRPLGTFANCLGEA